MSRAKASLPRSWMERSRTISSASVSESRPILDFGFWILDFTSIRNIPRVALPLLAGDGYRLPAFRANTADVAGQIIRAAGANPSPQALPASDTHSRRNSNASAD